MKFVDKSLIVQASNRIKKLDEELNSNIPVIIGVFVVVSFLVKYSPIIAIILTVLSFFFLSPLFGWIILILITIWLIIEFLNWLGEKNK